MGKKCRLNEEAFKSNYMLLSIRIVYSVHQELSSSFSDLSVGRLGTFLTLYEGEYVIVFCSSEM